MNRLNVKEATREELIGVVKQLHQQLRQHHTSSERVKELEKQVEQLKQKLREKESAVQALAQQNAMLSEKSAADEETISVLIKQLEDMNGGDANTTFSDSIVEARAVPAKAAPPSPGEKRTTGGRVVQAPVKGPGGGCVTESARVESSTVSPNAATIIAQKNKDLAMLEMKVRELTEVNTLYTAIVLHNDEEQHRGATKDTLSPKNPNAVTPVDLSSFHERIGVLENERDNLQRVVRQQNQENQVLMKELQDHRDELCRLELDLVAAERWKVSVATSSEAVEGMPSVHTSSPVQSEEYSSLRTSAQLVEPIQCKNKRGKSMPNTPARPRNTDFPADTHTPPRALTTSRSLHQLGTLPEIRLWNPSKQEKVLLERVELYRKCIEEMQAFELDRQRGFDEIERARAELFTEMNTKLEEQRREIQRLNKRLAAPASVYGDENEKKNVVHRPVRDVVTSPIVDFLQAERANMPSREVFSPVTAGANHILREDGSSWNNVDTKTRGGNEHIDEEDPNVDEKVLLEFLETVAVSAEMIVPEKEEVEIKEEEQDTTFSGDDENVNKQGVLPFGEEVKGRQEMCDSSLPKVEWTCKLMAMAEKVGRLGIYCEEGDGVVEMLLRSLSTIAAVAAGLTVQAAESARKVEVLEATLVEVRTSASSVEGREQELVADVARLQEEMTSVIETEDVKNNLTAVRKVFTFSLDATCAEESWEPLRCVRQAYSEVVDAQIALLRTASATVATSALSGEEFEHISNALDAIVAKDDRVANGINNNDESCITSCFKLVEEEGAEKHLGRDAPLSKKAPILSFEASTSSIRHSIGLLSAPMEATGNDECNTATGGQHLPSEAPSGQTANPKSESGGPWFEKYNAGFSLAPEEKVENDNCAPQPAGVSESSLQETRPASFVEEHMHKCANLAPTSGIGSFLGSESTTRFAPDPLDYFVTPRNIGNETQQGGCLHSTAPNVKTLLDLFGAAPPTESHPKQRGDNSTFVAEFDPFS